MGDKRDIKIIIVPILIVLVFLFGIMGYRQLLGPDFSLPGAVYSTFFFFILNNISPQDAVSNDNLLISRYLAALVFGLGIYSLLYKHLVHNYIRLKIKYTYRNHVVIFSSVMVGHNFFLDLLANEYKVILVEDSPENVKREWVEKSGIIVFNTHEHGTKLFDTMLLAGATACVIGFSDDNVNMELSLKVIEYLQSKKQKHIVKVLTHIGDSNNLGVIKDYTDINRADDHFEFDVFNIFSAAAKKIYDNYPPHNYLNFESAEEQAIAVAGYNLAAEDFLLENIIMSHYKDGRNIKIYLVDKEADNHVNHFMYKYPFSREFVDIVPIKLLNNKFFANFNWSKELIEKLSKVRAAYFFGSDGAELMNEATRFRQFLYGQIPGYLNAPIVICFPENSSIMNLLNADKAHSEQLSDLLKKQLNINFVNMISDTCTSSSLLHERAYVDMLSRIVNYFYAVKYEFAIVLAENYKAGDAAKIMATQIEHALLALPDKHKELSEQQVEEAVLQLIATQTNRTMSELRPVFGIRNQWDKLTYNNKTSNRYAARHLAVKLSVMKSLDCLPLSNENILHAFPVIAPIEHKRWCAEKMVQNYRFGGLPQEKTAKKNAKERLKIHDQLIPYDKLSDEEKEKDLNIFLLMPLLNSLKAEIKK